MAGLDTYQLVIALNKFVAQAYVPVVAEVMAVAVGNMQARWLFTVAT